MTPVGRSTACRDCLTVSRFFRFHERRRSQSLTVMELKWCIVDMEVGNKYHHPILYQIS
jgi:hypothetical protein